MVASILVSIAGLSIKFAMLLLHEHMGRNVITQLSTNQIHPAEIPQTSDFYVCKFTRPSSFSTCEGLVPRLVNTVHEQARPLIHGLSVKLGSCPCSLSSFSSWTNDWIVNMSGHLHVYSGLVLMSASKINATLE